MSRSLRTRPLTLYQSRDSQEPPIPPVRDSSASRGGDEAYDAIEPEIPNDDRAQAQPRAQKRLSGMGGAVKRVGKKSGLSKASDVGNNLKKRLSMRYAEPTEIGPGGFSAIPEVPSLPPQVVPGAPDLPPVLASAAQYGRSGELHEPSGRPMPIMGHGFDEDGGAPMSQSNNDLAYQEDAMAADTSLTMRPKASGDSNRASGSRSGLSLEGFAHDPAIDLEMLSHDKFDPQAYLRHKLAHSGEDFLLSFRSSLRATKEAASSDLKQQVFRNYQEFITISKEIATLENDMLELKELLGEWKTLPQALEIEEGASGASGTFGTLTDSALKRGGRGNRNSMIDLQQIYKAQIMSLWEGIEGSQKFLPFVPGRHLIAEASSFTELNSATYKPKQGVALFLLDDLLLVAVRKKRQMSARVRLVAERCFSLGEIVVIDLKDGGDLTNAVKIKRAKESFVYRTERSEDKRALLNAFRRVAEELASKRRKESQAEAEARKRDSAAVAHASDGERSSTSMSASSRPAGSSKTMAELLASPEGGGVAAVAGASIDKKDPSRWLNDFADELAVAIALREWGAAVSLVEKGRNVLLKSSRSEAGYEELSAKLHDLSSQLIAAISHDLASPNLKKTLVVRDASYLLRLDRGEKAREIFLNARTELLRRRSRQIKFEGDVSLHISELALVHFTLIKNTSEWYVTAFRDYKMASGFVRWAALQVEAYAEIFRRQVYGVVDQDPKVIQEAIDITMSSAQQLKDVGLDMSFFLRDLLRPDGHRQIPALTLTLADGDPATDSRRLSAFDIRKVSATPDPSTGTAM